MDKTLKKASYSLTFILLWYLNILFSIASFGFFFVCFVYLFKALELLSLLGNALGPIAIFLSLTSSVLLFRFLNIRLKRHRKKSEQARLEREMQDYIEMESAVVVRAK